MYGSIMLINGGYFADHKKLLNDFALFDCDLNEWIKTRVYCYKDRIDNQD